MLRKTVLVRALSIAFSASVLSIAAVPGVMAQTNATGNILGKVAPDASASISVVGIDNGLRRTIVDAFDAEERRQVAHHHADQQGPQEIRQQDAGALHQ